MKARASAVILALIVALSLTGSADAVIVFFKDGFTLTGRIKRDATTVEGVLVPKGTYYVDDDARRFLFAQSLVEDGDNKNDPRDADLVRLANPKQSRNNTMDPVEQIISISPINKNWHRQFKYRGADGVSEVTQRITYLTPRIVRFDAMDYMWGQCYLTDELGVDVIQPLLTQYGELKPKGDAEDVKRRFKVFRFLLQAGWMPQAEKELDGIAKEFPGESEKIQEAKDAVKQAKINNLLEEIERAHTAGRHKRAQEGLKIFPTDDNTIDEKILARVRELKRHHDTMEETLTQARKHLQTLPASPALDKWLKEASAKLLEDLDPQIVSRLEPFLAQAQVHERQVKEGEKSDPAQVLALGISGWLMGKAAAETNVDNARKLWQARNFVLEYLRTAKGQDRERLAKDFRSQKDALALDELAHMIRFLPPPDPEKKIDTEPMELRARAPGTTIRNLEYSLVLPPEYHHGRAYPVLVALGHAEEKPKEMLSRFARHAGEHGYILVVPDWNVHGKKTYQYTSEEHDVALDVLRDVRWRFHVDADRIFLAGLGEGANMAFDVGLSHPDAFAGVLPMSGTIRYYPEIYETNGKYLPFYVVGGDQAGRPSKDMAKLFIDKWIPQAHPAIFVQYKGRTLEWFGGELNTMFDWMNRKKRPPTPNELGKTDREFRSMRAADNRFYWLSTNSIQKERFNDITAWKYKEPAKFQGKIAENKVNLAPFGMKQLTIWLQRETVDMNKPVQVRVHGGNWREFKVKPDLEVMMEDLFDRGDRTRLFMARIEVDKL